MVVGEHDCFEFSFAFGKKWGRDKSLGAPETNSEVPLSIILEGSEDIALIDTHMLIRFIFGLLDNMTALIWRIKLRYMGIQIPWPGAW